MNSNNMGTILGEIGCQFRSNIESHIIDYKLQKGDDVEWLLEPLTEISHSADIVLDAFQYGTKWDTFYQLYFHDLNAKSKYIPYNLPLKSKLLSKIKSATILYGIFDNKPPEMPEPNPYDMSMLVQETLDIWSKDEIPSIWNELIVPFNEIGIWQAVLLNETKALFPKWWHANYLKKIYVFSDDDMQEIIDCPKRKSYDFDQEKLASYLGCDDIMPSVEIDGDKAVVSFYFWNDWSGFCRRSTPIERKGKSVVFGEPEREVLVKYDCGILY